MFHRAVPLAIVCGALAPSALATPLLQAPRSGFVSPAATAADDPVGAHAAIAQAQERLAEVDATISVLQESAQKLAGALRQRAKDAVAGLRAIRDAYRKEIDEVIAQARTMTVTQLAAAEAALTKRWTMFEQALDADVAEIKLDLNQKKALIRARIEAEKDYLRSRVIDLEAKAAALTAQERAVIERRIAKLQVRAEEAESRLGKLKDAGRGAWSVLKQGFVRSGQILEDAYSEPR